MIDEIDVYEFLDPFEEEPLPCPKCDEVDFIVLHDQFNKAFVKCCQCGYLSDENLTMYLAIREWNGEDCI